MYKIKLEELNCMSCVRNIEESLKEADSTLNLQANVKEKILTIATQMPIEKVKRLIEEAGYSVGASENISEQEHGR